jgi:hypothetical protein
VRPHAVLSLAGAAPSRTHSAFGQPYNGDERAAERVTLGLSRVWQTSAHPYHVVSHFSSIFLTFCLSYETDNSIATIFNSSRYFCLCIMHDIVPLF